MKKQDLWVAGAVLCGFLLTSCGGRAQTKLEPSTLSKPLPVLQKPLKIHLKQQSFTEMLTAFRQASGLNLMADGSPRLQKADLDLEGTVKQGLDQLAKTFDYRWNLSKSGIVLLNKRFQDHLEAPQTNPGELKHAARQIVDELSAIPFDRRKDGYVLQLQELGRSLDETQWLQLKSGQRLTQTQLTPNQFDLLQNGANAAYYGEVYTHWNDFLTLLAALPDSYVLVSLDQKSSPEFPLRYLNHYARDKNKEWIVTQFMSGGSTYHTVTENGVTRKVEGTN